MISDTSSIVGGVRHPYTTTPKMIDDMQTFETRDDDVFVITYPKSGTTWMLEIVSLLQKECSCESVDEQFLSERITFLEHHTPGDLVPEYTVAKNLPSPRLFKSHLQNYQLPPQIVAKKPKVVFVSRNPKDTAVSFFHFHNGSNIHRSYDLWSEFLADFSVGDVIRGSWFEMNCYWWSQRHHKNVMFVKYEDMQKNLAGIIEKVGEFLGRSIPDGKLPEMIKHCSFDSMRSNDKVNHSENPILDITISPFMRTGKVGGWKDYFTVAQNEAFDKLYSEKMEGTGLDFEYEI